MAMADGEAVQQKQWHECPDIMQNVFAFLARNEDAVNCSMACKAWHSMQPALPSIIHINVLQSQPSGHWLCWLADNIGRVGSLTLQQPEQWPTAGVSASRRKQLSKQVAEVVCGALQDASHMRVLALERLHWVPGFKVLGQCTNLQQLTLSKLVGLTCFPPISSSWSSAAPLQLSIVDCPNLHCLSDSIGQLLSLQQLVVDECRLIQLPEALGQLTGLVELRLTGCSHLQGLPTSIGRLRRLRQLDVRFDQWADVEEFTLPETLGGLQSLELFTIGCHSLHALPSSIGSLASLTLLKLDGTSRLAAVPESIGQLSKLQRLVLRYNGYKGPPTAPLPNSLGGLSALTDLEISCWGNTKELLPESVGGLSALKRLVLFWHMEVRSLPASISSLTGLTELVIRDLKHIRVLPDELGHLSSLKELTIRGCYGLDMLPASLVCLSSLQRLYIDGHLDDYGMFESVCCLLSSLGQLEVNGQLLDVRGMPRQQIV